MDDFNAKKSRAQKFRNDKYHDKSKSKRDSGSHSSKGDGKDINQGKLLAPTEKSDDNEPLRSGGEDGESQTFSKRKLMNNWDRYEETVVSQLDEEDDASAALFEELLSVPIAGGHLKMKHEHEWGKEKSELQMPWFQLDVQAVERNLTTIPFHKRQDLPSHIFTENHLHRMVLRAKQNATSLSEVKQTILRMRNLSTSNSTNIEIDSKDKSMVDVSVVDKRDLRTQKRPAEVAKEDDRENEDLDKLLALEDRSLKPVDLNPVSPDINTGIKDNEKSSQQSPQSPRAPAPAASLKPTVSLDDWLDSILDD